MEVRSKSTTKTAADNLPGSDVWNGVDYHSPTAGDRYPTVNASGISEYLINGGGHHWDSYGILDIDAEPDFIREAHLWEIRTVRKWLDAWTVSREAETDPATYADICPG
jgi:hypothetical protein